MHAVTETYWSADENIVGDQNFFCETVESFVFFDEYQYSFGHTELWTATQQEDPVKLSIRNPPEVELGQFGLHAYILSQQRFPGRIHCTDTVSRKQPLRAYVQECLDKIHYILLTSELESFVYTSKTSFDAGLINSNSFLDKPLQISTISTQRLFQNIEYKSHFQQHLFERENSKPLGGYLYPSYSRSSRRPNLAVLLFCCVVIAGLTAVLPLVIFLKPTLCSYTCCGWICIEKENHFLNQDFIKPQVENFCYRMASPVGQVVSGGFPLSILKTKPDSKFLCAKCRLLLRKPIQSFCGHRYCKLCIDQLLKSKKDEETICPMCLEEDSENEYSVLRHDQTFPDNAIKRELKQLQASCPNEGCTWNGPFLEYEKHEKECVFKKMSCPNCGEEITEQEKVAHNLECTAQVSDSGLRKQVAEIKKKMATLEETVMQLASNVSGGSGSSMSSLSGAVSQQFEALKVQVATHEEALKAYQDMFVVMSREVERNTNLINECKTQLREATQQKHDVEPKLQAMERDLAVKNATMADMNNQIEALETSTHDGILIWKIEDFARRRSEAIGGQRTSLYSPAFYTSRTGYKMCARVYLNGDGMGKGNHISLFFVVMKGKYDNLLRWPFRQKVTLTLLDQNLQAGENVVDAFRPDPNSTSFKKPTTAMNIASGCPLFMPLSQLDNPAHSYVRDDCIFIKINVDLSDL